MSLDILPILNSVVDHALLLGLFERVNTHEPKSAPGNGLSAAIWVDSIAPAPTFSGLANSTGRLVFKIRIFSNMLQEPQDAIDPNILDAVSKLAEAYSGDFDLGGSVKNVDILGAAGVPFGVQAGYLNIDNKIYRVMDLTMPVIVNDIWEQVN